jgi:hypothetical protein
LRGLVPDDGDARLELGHLDVGHEPPREARHQPLLHALEVLRVLVARHDDLAVHRVERVERVEELFLRLLAAREELDVVDEEHVALRPVARAELVHAMVLDGRDEVVREALRGHVDDARVGRSSCTRWAIACIRWVLPRPVPPQMKSGL